MSLQVAITRRLGRFKLDVEFAFDGGIAALFGPSGAGKTQTLRCIAGLGGPDCGRIVMSGRVLFDSEKGIDVPARHRRTGYVLQEHALFPHMDVAANVGYGLPGAGQRGRAARVAELLELIDMEGAERARPHELSGGQRQRVALARALAPRPDMLLLDEPFSSVDALTRRQLRAELRSIHQRTGVPMLLVTHDLSEVREVAGQVALFEEGRALQSGATEDVLAAPANRDVAELLAAAGFTSSD